MKWRSKNPEKAKAIYAEFMRRNGDRVRAERKARYAADPKHHRRWALANPERYAMHLRKSALKKNFGLSLEDYDAMLESQGGCCAICDATKPGANRKHFAVDHDHATGAVRGLLCNNCNYALGLLRDDPALFLSAERYLQKHRRPRLVG
jgi:hypothetical protein